MVFTPKIRAGFFEKLGGFSKSFLEKLASLPETPRIWIHAVSVGELNAAKPLINALIQQNYPIILSNTTATGHQLALKSYPELPIFYFPFDFPWVIQKTLTCLNPALIVILETEIWPNLMVMASQHKIPVLLLNGRLSSRSFNGYHKLRHFFAWVLNHCQMIAMQSDEDAQRMRQLGVSPERVMVGGNIKFDLPQSTNEALVDALKSLFLFPENAPVLIFASTHQGEEDLFLELYTRLQDRFPDLKMVIAPRHPERFKSVESLLMKRQLPYVNRSQLTPESPNSNQAPIVLLDSIGELNAAFSLGTIACMGGTFIEWGGHNPLEPINAGIPVVFGPSMFNFKAIAAKVLEAGAGFQASNTEDLQHRIESLLTQPETYQATVENGQRLMAQNRGITQQFLKLILSALSQSAN